MSDDKTCIHYPCDDGCLMGLDTSCISYITHNGLKSSMIPSKKINKYDKHQEIVNAMNKLYREKNEAYGDAFAKTFKKYGLKSSIIRISDKFQRLEALINGAENKTDESIKDTLRDMANYCIMTLIEMDD